MVEAMTSYMLFAIGCLTFWCIFAIFEYGAMMGGGVNVGRLERYKNEDGTVGEVTKQRTEEISICDHLFKKRVGQLRSGWSRAGKWSEVCIKCGVCK